MKRYWDIFVRKFFGGQINDTSALIILGVVVLLFFTPFLFLGKIFLNGDATSYTYPIAYFFQHHSGVPLNQFSFSGYPAVAAFHFGYFHPLYNLFFRLFDFLLAYHLMLFIDLCLAIFFTYRFAREIQMGVYGALLTALSFVFSQFSLAWISSINIVHATALLPTVFYAVLKVSRGDRRYLWVLAGAFGVALLATHYQFIVFAGIGSCLYFGYLLWQKRITGQYSGVDATKDLLWFLGAFCVAFIIGSPQFFHTLHLFMISARATSFSYHSVWYFDLLRYILPTFSIPYLSTEEFFPYIGIVPFFFAIGVLWGDKRKVLNTDGRFFLYLFLFSLLTTLKYSPVVLVLKILPVLKSFGELSRWLYLGNFSLAILAGFGFEYVRSGVSADRLILLRKIGKKICIGGGIFLVGMSSFFFLFGQRILSFAYGYFDTHLYEKTIKLPLVYYHGLIAILIQKLFFNVSLANHDVIYLCIFASLGYFLLELFQKNKILFSNTVVVITVLNLVLVSTILVKTGDAQLLRAPSAIAQFIKTREKDTQDFRVFGFLIPFTQYQKITALRPDERVESLIFSREALMGNFQLFSEIPIIGGYDPLVLGRYQELLHFVEDDAGKENVERKQLNLLSHMPLLSMMNTKYILSPYPFDSCLLKLIFSEKVTHFEVPLYLYENLQVLPPFYFASSTHFLREGALGDNFKLLTSAEIDPTKTTFIECDTCRDKPFVKDLEKKVTLVTRDASHAVFHTESSTAEWLVLSNTFVPGWHATIDGKLAQIYYANYVYQAIEIEPGKHIVSFSYDI